MVRHGPSAIVVLEACIEMVCEAQTISDIVTHKLAYRRCVRHELYTIVVLEMPIGMF